VRRTLPLLVLVAALATMLLPTAISGATAQVTGTMTIREDVTLGADAVAVFTIVGQNASNKAGGIVGFQRINNAATPVAFSVAYDTASIDPKESYAIFGSIIDGSTVYQTFEPVPVITGGPTSDISLVATAEVPAGAGAVTGTIEIPGNASLSSSAVAVAVLVDETTGTTVARQVIATPGNSPIAFSIAVDPGVIDPTDTYVAKAGVVDGSDLWAGLNGVPAVENGELLTGVTVKVTPAKLPVQPTAPPATTAPTAEPTAEPTPEPTPEVTPEPTPEPTPEVTPEPTPSPTATPTPTPTATATPTASPSPTPSPSATPTPTPRPTLPPRPTPTVSPSPSPTPSPSPSPAPTPTATPTPTASPTPTPTASPTPTPSPTPSPTPTPTPTPTASASPTATPTVPPNTGLIRGTLTYDEPKELSADARAVVFLVDVTVGPNGGTVIASTEVKDPGAQPIPFELAYPFAVVDDANQYQLFAGIVDGDSAWATPTGVGVPVPQAEVAGVVLELEYRPDLLKGAVTGSITGADLGPITNPDAYGTSILIDTTTGATIGFQMISPIVAQPIPFSAPFDTSTIDPTATYVARGSVWDGTTLWNTPTGTAVITQDNPKSGIVLTVVPAVTTAQPADDPGRTWLPWIILLIAFGIGIAVFLWWRSRQETEPPDGPETPPPPPGPDTPPPPPGGERAGGGGPTGGPPA
jgi:uncharacterized lipoprotein YbaY